MNLLMVILFVTAFLGIESRRTRWHCNIYGNGISGTTNGVEEDTSKHGCNAGHIHWSYPKGKLILTFLNNRSSARFRVCLKKITRSFGNIRDVSIGFTPKDLTLEGEELCTCQRPTTNAIIEIQAPEQFLYRASLQYRIDRQ